MKSAIYVLNRTLSSTPSSNSSTNTPFKIFYKKKPNIDNFNAIGCRAYVHIPDCKRKKLDSKAIPCWLVGYGEETKGWILYDPVSRKIILSRNVTFEELLLISDFKDGTERNKSKHSDCTLLFDPFVLSTEIPYLELGLLLDPDTTDTVPKAPPVVMEEEDETPPT